MLNQIKKYPPLPIPVRDAWFVHREGVLTGPHLWTEEQINHLIYSGDIRPTDLLWRHGFDNWFLSSNFNHPQIQEKRRFLNQHIEGYNPISPNPHEGFEQKTGRAYIPGWDSFPQKIRRIRSIGTNLFLASIFVFAWFGYEQIGAWSILAAAFMFLPGAYLLIMPVMGLWLAYEGSWIPIIMFAVTFTWTRYFQAKQIAKHMRSQIQ